MKQETGKRVSLFLCIKLGLKTDLERGVEGECVEWLWRSGDAVEAYPLLGDLVDA